MVYILTPLEPAVRIVVSSRMFELSGSSECIQGVLGSSNYFSYDVVIWIAFVSSRCI